MKTKDVLRLMQITRPTLCKYKKLGVIGVNNLPNGRFDYKDEDVFRILNKENPRKTLLYARVSTSKQRNDLRNQAEQLQNFASANGFVIDGVYKDVASGISFEKRKEFHKLLDLVMENKVKRVVVTYKDRLSRIGFDLFQHLFLKHGTEIIVMNGTTSKEQDSKEVFDEIVSFLHCFSMRLYSRRKQNALKEICKE